MKRKVIIEFTWWPAEDRKAKVQKKHQEALEESAIERVTEMMKQGYREGELHDLVRMDDADGPDGVYYQGWWSITKK